jgi:phytoene/squalene synthetase
MAEPALSAPAGAVRRFDPALFATALFAAEPARERLMVLYAADIELSRAVQPARRADAGPLIAAMRLQWWRDVAERAPAGGEPPAHEIAGPFAALAAEGWLDRDRVLRLVEGHAAETEAVLPEEAFDAWAEGRFGARTALAAGLLGAGDHVEAAAAPIGRALGAAFALRTAAAMAAEGRSLLPGITPGERADLAGGRVGPELAGRAKALAGRGLTDLAEARRAARRMPRAALPALMPAWAAGRVLRRAAAAPKRLAGLAEPSPARRAAGLAVCALIGRI